MNTKNSPKNPPKRRTKNPLATGANEARNEMPAPAPPSFDFYRWFLIGLFFVVSIGGTYLVTKFRDPAPNTPRFTYEIVAEHDHDSNAFTQGLVYDDDLVWESTGLIGQSKLRKWNLESGEIVKEISLEGELFGEGLTIANDRLYQLTYKAGKCLVYDRDFNLLETHTYEGQGWGLTFDGKSLIMSNGSSRLVFRDPETFEQQKVLTVRQGRRSIPELNELEFSGGKIIANRLNSDYVYEIDPESGQVEGIIDLTGLWPVRQRPEQGVLNGIAIDPIAEKILVTGKLCPKIFEIKLKRK